MITTECADIQATAGSVQFNSRTITINSQKLRLSKNLTRSTGPVRGLHLQCPPYAEIKIVTCLKGQVWDVAVDMRRGSSTLEQHHTVLLNEDNNQSHLIPEGFAHSCQTLAADCEMLYFHTGDYDTRTEGALNACDTRLIINCPEFTTGRSERDTNHATLTDDFHGIDI